MTLILSGTDGLSDVDGSAATPAIRGTDTNTGIFFPAADTIAFSEGGAEVARFDSSGNLGIGLSPFANSLSKSLDIVNGVGLFGSGNNTYISANAYYDSDWKYKATDEAAFIGLESGSVRFNTASSGTAGNNITFTERMRIDSSGNLLVGATTAFAPLQVSKAAINANDGQFLINSPTAGDSNICGMSIIKFANDTTTAQVFARFGINNGASGCGQINANGANTAAFGSYSDSRLKENIVDLPSQLDNIMALRPVEYDYIESMGGGHQIGFVAQEVQVIYPDLVGETEDGMLTLTDMNKNDARLIKAIQEMKAIIDTQASTITQLQADVAALKGTP